MMPGLSSPNYKNGKYVFGFFNKRDFAILATSISISLVIVFMGGNLDTFFKLVTINLLIFVIIMPVSHYHSVYTFVHYLFRYLRINKTYKWGGVEHVFEEKENE